MKNDAKNRGSISYWVKKYRVKWPFWSHWAGPSRSTCFYAVDCYVSWESEFGEKHLTQSYPLPKMMYLTPKSNSIFKWVELNMSLSHIEFF